MIRVCFVSVLLLSALSPLPGLAQVSPPPLVAAPPGQVLPSEESSEEKPSGEIIPRSKESLSGSEGRAGRVVLESLGGVLLGAVGGVPAFGLSLLFTFDCDGCHNTNGEATILALAGVAGFLGGTALGVKLGGALLGGEGRYLPTLAGAGLGTLAGILVALPTGLLVNELLAVAPLIAGPFVGAIIGYELSHSKELERKASGTRVTVLPSVSLRASGGVVAGLVGSF